MQSFPPTRRHKPSESGYMLISVMILLAVFLIAMAVAAPKVAESIQRDRELETMQRGKQYIRAIKLYYKKFHAYPPSVDALVKTNEIRFLRKKYIDPMTGKDDWKPIMFCQNKTPMAMGFFGQPLGGAGCGALAGTGPGGVPAPPGNAPGPQGPGLFSSPTSGTSTSTASPTGAGSDPNSGAGSVDANGNPINTTGSPLGTGQAFGGGGIVGVEPVSPKQSILIYKKKNHYNEWEFLYSPLSDQQMIAGGNAGGINPAGGGQNGQNGGLFIQDGQGGQNGQGGGLNQNGGGVNQPGPNGPGNTPVLPPDTAAPPPQ